MGIRMKISVVLVVLIFIVYSYKPELFTHAMQLLRDGNVEAVAAYIRSFGAGSAFVSIVLSVAMTFTMVIPFILISAANGLVFGLIWGTVVSWLGEVIGAVVAFTVYRYWLRPSVLRRFGQTKQWYYVDKISGVHGFKTVLTARILPVIPSGILTAAASVSAISFGDFFWATLLGKIPSVFVKVLIGHDFLYFERYANRLLWGLLILLLLYCGAWLKRREDCGQFKVSNFPAFLYRTFIHQEKNRRDLLDYMRALCIITMIILIALTAGYYGINWR